ncbi:hypothetical protein SAMN05445504_6990 [Burkholderia sp. CF099]|nr:hypothetical protein SAMN05445504_6990 [Burkholderia sp. CF099]
MRYQSTCHVHRALIVSDKLRSDHKLEDVEHSAVVFEATVSRAVVGELTTWALVILRFFACHMSHQRPRSCGDRRHFRRTTSTFCPRH